MNTPGTSPYETSVSSVKQQLMLRRDAPNDCCSASPAPLGQSGHSPGKWVRDLDGKREMSPLECSYVGDPC